MTPSAPTRLSAPSGVVLVIRIDSPDAALVAARGAIAGGIDAVEITTTVPDAMQVIAELVREHPQVPIGAGTILESAQVDAAHAAGARFVVSPDSFPDVIERAAALELPMVPGALTPTEVQRAHRAGVAAVKIFPVGSVGGPQYISELRGPLPHVSYVASGGITEANAADYFAAGAVAVCVGRSILDAEALAAGDLPALRAQTERFMRAARRRTSS